MNVAENVRRARPVELDCLLRASFIEAQVEAFAAIERKNIVEPRIEIGKIHEAAERYDEQARFEHLVVLDHAVLSCRGYQSRGLNRALWAEPNDGAGCVLQGSVRPCAKEFQLAGNIKGFLRRRTVRSGNGPSPKSQKQQESDRDELARHG